MENENICTINTIVYEDDKTCLWFCGQNRELYRNDDIISFKQFIREIDIIPIKSPEWKRAKIFEYGKKTGFLQNVA